MADVKRSNKWKGLVIAAAAAVVGFGLMALMLREWRRTPAQSDARPAAVAESQATAAQQPAASAAQDGRPATGPGAAWGDRAGAAPTTARAAESGGGGTALESIFGAAPDPGAPAVPGQRVDLLQTLAIVTMRLTLAALLSAMLAFRPRRSSLYARRNPFVAQTQILMAVVASALMMVVGDSAARAFGIFAAASLVRFRTNIKDPKEITVLLLSLAIGLATGVGRWELGVILAFFSLLLLWGLEYREPELTRRLMELSVATRDADRTQDVLLQIFKKYGFDAELRTLDRPDGDDSLGSVVYNVNVSPLVSTDRLSNEILVADPDNIDKVEWSQQKNNSYFYQ